MLVRVMLGKRKGPVLIVSDRQATKVRLGKESWKLEKDNECNRHRTPQVPAKWGFGARPESLRGRNPEDDERVNTDY